MSATNGRSVLVYPLAGKTNGLVEHFIVVSGILEPISQVMLLAHITNLGFGNIAAWAWTTTKEFDTSHKYPYHTCVSSVQE